jgi:hypothetical protein
MDIVNGHPDHETSCTPVQATHVYKHVNSENLESSASFALNPAFLKAKSDNECSSPQAVPQRANFSPVSNLEKNEVR